MAKRLQVWVHSAPLAEKKKGKNGALNVGTRLKWNETKAFNCWLLNCSLIVAKEDEVQWRPQHWLDPRTTEHSDRKLLFQTQVPNVVSWVMLPSCHVRRSWAGGEKPTSAMLLTQAEKRLLLWTRTWVLTVHRQSRHPEDGVTLDVVDPECKRNLNSRHFKPVSMQGKWLTSHSSVPVFSLACELGGYI